MLSDFEPKGATARDYGFYLDAPGISDRATVWIDAQGVVRYASSVGPGGERDIPELVALSERLASEYTGPRASFKPAASTEGAVLFVRAACGFSRAARVALDNLHLSELEVRNVSREPEALDALRKHSGAEVAPCLVLDGEVVVESAQIIQALADRVAPLG